MIPKCKQTMPHTRLLHMTCTIRSKCLSADAASTPLVSAHLAWFGNVVIVCSARMIDPLTDGIFALVDVSCWGRFEMMVFRSSLLVSGRRYHGVRTNLGEGLLKDLKLDLRSHVVLDGSLCCTVRRSGFELRWNPTTSSSCKLNRYIYCHLYTFTNFYLTHTQRHCDLHVVFGH